jgi:hypothetical protein
MSLRIPQAYVSVVATEPQSGELRVRRLYADVLISTSATGLHEETVNQALGITDAAIGRIETQDASNNLALTQIANLTYTLNVTDTINFVDRVGQAFPVSVTSNLALVDSHIAINYVGERSPAGSVLALTQCVQTLQTLAISQDLGISDSVAYWYPTKPYVTQFMSLAQHVSTPYHMWVEHTLGFTQLGKVPITHSVAHTLNFVQETDMLYTVHTLNFTQNAQHAFGLWVSQDLGVTDWFWVRSASHDLGISHSLTWHEDTPCARKQYSPFQGEGSADAPPQTLQDPQGSVTDRFSVYQPALGVRSLEVILRAPEMDNRDRNAYNRVQGETRGGKLRVYADPIWPKVRTLAVTIVGLTEAEVDEFQTFVAATLGQSIGLTDWEGRLWEGVITTPDEVATQDGKARWTLSFELEGEMLTVEQPAGSDGMAMNLSQTVSAVIV